MVSWPNTTSKAPCAAILPGFSFDLQEGDTVCPERVLGPERVNRLDKLQVLVLYSGLTYLIVRRPFRSYTMAKQKPSSGKRDPSTPARSVKKATPSGRAKGAAKDKTGKRTVKPTPERRKPSRGSRAPRAAAKGFPIVGIGASAGGLEALEDLFNVSPPGGHVALLDRKVQLMEGPKGEMPPHPIDFFFRSLAQDQKERAICIVLSGTGTDGTLGLKAIKGESGMAMVQEVQSARYAGMPASAIATSLADYVLPPAAMPAQLVAYASYRLRKEIREMLVFARANHAAAAMFGVERGRLPNRKFSDFVQRDAQDDWYRHRRQVLASNEKQTVQLALHQADGSSFSARLECSPRPGATAEAWRSMTAVIDVTRRQTTEEELRRLNVELDQRVAQRTAELAAAEGHCRSLAEQSPNMIYIRCRGRIVYANPTCEEITGYTREGFYAPEFDSSAVVAPESADLLRSSYEGVLAGERVEPSELTLVSKSGKRIEVIHSVSFELGSSTLYRLGLKEAVEELCEGLETRHDIHFVVESAGDIGDLDEGVSHELFKATRELLFNVVKHAGVKEACVRMEREGDHLKIAVQDRGKGFLQPHGDTEEDPVEEGIGLLCVRERMRGFGGRMRIESEPGVGTGVTLWMPVGGGH